MCVLNDECMYVFVCVCVCVCVLESDVQDTNDMMVCVTH